MFAEFIAEEGAMKGLILSLERGEEWIVGRDPDLCTIVIEDPKTSRQHFRIRKTDAGYVIENLSTSNPVLINGLPIAQPTQLKEEDRVTVGGTVFRFYQKGAPFTYVFEDEPDEEPTRAEKKGPEGRPEERKEEEFAAPLEHGEERPSEAPVDEIFEEEEEGVAEKGDLGIYPDTFDESEIPELQVDLEHTTRFLIKVIAGPNTGAEFALDYDKSYLLGTDTALCDIILNDLSVSREHARLVVSKEGAVTIQDLGSRNGVVVDKERITGTKTVTANSVVSLGTSAFLLIDREAPSETIAAPLFEAPSEEVEEEIAAPEEEREEELVAARVAPRRLLPGGTVVFALIIAGLAVLFGIGLVSLFKTQEITQVSKDYVSEIEQIVKKYPAVRFTFNGGNGKLFLLGHVKTGVEHNELLYQLGSLGYIQGIEDNVVNDEAVWQEMNILLSKHAEFKGVTMHSPEAGVFVINGYLQTEKQAADLTDYLNLNFNYLNLLRNNVIVEESISDEVTSRLLQQGYGAVNPALTSGDLQLTGYINSPSDLRI